MTSFERTVALKEDAQQMQRITDPQMQMALGEALGRPPEDVRSDEEREEAARMEADVQRLALEVAELQRATDQVEGLREKIAAAHDRYEAQEIIREATGYSVTLAAIKPSDVLVFHSDQRMSADTMDRLRTTVREYLGLNNRIIVLDKGMTLKITDPNDALGRWEGEGGQ